MRMYKRWVSCFLIACLIMVCLCSCKPSKDTWSESDFKLSLQPYETTVTVGKEVVFTAELTNISNYFAEIKHSSGMPCFFFFKADEGEPEKHYWSDERTTFLRSGKSLTNSGTFTPDKPGQYILQVEMRFTIDDQEFVLNLDDININVIE